MHHALIRVVMKDRLFFSPIGDSPGRVIDLCTGTGIWAIEFADLFPSAEIIGNDLSPIQPRLVPPNVKFIIDDVEDEWGYENDPFDFIHARYLTGTLKNMPRLLEQSFACLKPGGWAEFQDWDAMVQSADDSTKDTSIEQYFLNTLPAFESAGYSTRPGRYLEKWMKDAGFVNIQVHKHIVPLGTWAKDKRYVCFPYFASSPLLFLFSITTNISMDSWVLGVEYLNRLLTSPLALENNRCLQPPPVRRISGSECCGCIDPFPKLVKDRSRHIDCEDEAGCKEPEDSSHIPLLRCFWPETWEAKY
ncbi:methyltransferase [Histoplasma capsulatum G186AR]|uniref:Methyltransferase n=1 Tax=Ajellomyces capsulatus TaxID=5037 RepID=A0A8H7ZB12_AJECA|nr:methyltransferase [Histoplasma capsulatum]QSS70051.1 methyltransferase [Histoplasma capsulatum G186AR]